MINTHTTIIAVLLAVVCTTTVSAQGCTSGLCYNGGYCNTTSTLCQCNGVYIGSFCNSTICNVNSNPCLNGGVCTATSYTSYVCSCAALYSGTNCQDEADPTQTVEYQDLLTAYNGLKYFYDISVQAGYPLAGVLIVLFLVASIIYYRRYAANQLTSANASMLGLAVDVATTAALPSLDATFGASINTSQLTSIATSLQNFSAAATSTTATPSTSSTNDQNS